MEEKMCQENFHKLFSMLKHLLFRLTVLNCVIGGKQTVSFSTVRICKKYNWEESIIFHSLQMKFVKFRIRLNCAFSTVDRRKQCK